jgi:hypothetical protein
MTEIRKHMEPQEEHESHNTQRYQNNQVMAAPLTPKTSKNDRPLDSTPTSHQSKRPDTRTTPRSDPMIMDVKQHSEKIGEHALQLAVCLKKRCL